MAQMGERDRAVLVSPGVSEKSYRLMEEGRYVFKVDPRATKIDIASAVESVFGVHVKAVNTMNRKGKRKRNRRSMTYGKRPDTKRAVVTLVAGERIDLFER